MNSRLAILCFIFAVAFGFSLYLQACTASIYPDYQPDIGWVRWFNPMLVLVIFFIAAWFLARRNADLRVFLLLGLVECSLLFLIILIGSFVQPQFSSPPVPHTLLNTVSFSLTHPQFSNRSYAVPFYTAILLSILLLIYRSRLQRHERKA